MDIKVKETHKTLINDLDEEINVYRQKLEAAILKREQLAQLQNESVPLPIDAASMQNLGLFQMSEDYENTVKNEDHKDHDYNIKFANLELATSGPFPVIIPSGNNGGVELLFIQTETEERVLNIKKDNLNVKNDVKFKKQIPSSMGCFTCDFCDVMIPTKRLLQQHIRSHLRNNVKRNIFKCDQCDETFTRLNNFQCHKAQHDGIQPYSCDVCGAEYLIMSQLKVHRRRKHNIKEGKTPGPREITYPDLIGRKKHPCTLCGKNLANGSSLRVHMRSHDADRFACAWCKLVFRTRRERAQHAQSDHQQVAAHFCEHCPTHFYYADDLKLHTHKHKRPNYMCTFCTRVFNNLTHCNNHMRRHTGDRPFTCEICGKSFFTHSYLNTHVRNHELYKKNMLNCDLCGKRFKGKFALEQHMNVHKPLKVQNCSVCQKNFSNKFALVQHMRTHTGERPFACHLCDKSYTVKLGLEKHLLRHLGEGPYPCTVCSGRFYSSYDLKRHMTKHSPEKRFTCNICNKSYSFNSSYVKHVQKHSNELSKADAVDSPAIVESIIISPKKVQDLTVENLIHIDNGREIVNFDNEVYDFA